MSTPLSEWLKEADAMQKRRVVVLSGLSRNMLYRASVAYYERDGYGRRLSPEKLLDLVNAINSVVSENHNRTPFNRTSVYPMKVGDFAYMFGGEASADKLAEMEEKRVGKLVEDLV